MKRIRFIIAAVLTLAITVGMLAALGTDKAQAANDRAPSGQYISETTEDGLQVYFRTSDPASWAEIVGYVGTKTEVVIPAYIGKHRVYEIYSRAFEGNKTITSVELPYAMKKIGAHAFKDCTALKKVTFGDYFKLLEEENGKVSSSDAPVLLGMGAFAGCVSLEEIEFTYGIAEDHVSDEGVFSGSGLKKATVCWTYGTNINYIFKNAEKLEKLVIKARDDRKYYRWVNLQTESYVDMPSLKEVDIYDCDCVHLNGSIYTQSNGKKRDVFTGCPNLKNINMYYDKTDENGKIIGFTDDTGSKPVYTYDARIRIIESCMNDSEEYKNKTYTAVSSDTSVINVKSDGTSNKFNIVGAGTAVISHPSMRFTVTVKVGGASSKKNLSECKLTMPIKQVTFIGSEIIPYLYLTDGKTVLEEGKDYTVTASDNTEIGEAKLTITGIGNYTGSITEKFEIIPVKTELRSVTIGKKSSTVTVVENKQADGYQIYYSSKKNKGFKKHYSGTDTKAKVTKLKSGMYIKVRTYKKVGKTTYYSEWSAPVQVK